MSIVCFRQHRTITDEQIDSIQESVAQEIDRVLKCLDLSARTLELNDNKPEVAYRNIMQARFTLKNLVSDLKLDTRI